MARHEITVAALRNYLDQESWHEAASSCGEGSSKMLMVSNAGWLKVVDHGVVVHTGKELAAAVAVYNDCN